MGHLETAAEVDAQFGGTLESVSSAYYILEDAAHAIRAELDQLEFEPGRLDMIESRLNEINGLKRKYGSSIEEVLAYGSRIEEEIETIVNKDSHVQQLQDQLRSLENDLSVEAENLTIARKKWAKKLTVSIHEQLKQLYMDKTKFEVKFLTDGDAVNRKFKKDGWDEVEFYISTNPGEPLKPLSKVASGGELSRIMLALKTIFSKHQGITSIIFDEVDTGVSGRVAQSIAEKIYQVAVHSQVMCISHLPQVAAMADCHLFISKKQENGRTSTKVKRLEENEKIQEISRMISGVEITDLTLEHAKELLHLAGSIKET